MSYLRKSFDGLMQRLCGAKAAQGLLSRALVLLATLCFIKVAMISGLQQHLYQSHWRIGSHALNWLDKANYFIFIALLVGSFVYLGRRSASFGSPTVRWLNVGFVVVGLVFAFLSFYWSDYNY